VTTVRGADEQRVAEIERYRILDDTAPRRDLVALVEVAAEVARVPMATINLITDAEQHQVAAVGFDAAVCRREDSMCNAVLHDGRPVVVPDASLDERFRDNPFVTGAIGDVRFYATHQLVTPNGIVIGTLCVFDTVPRQLTDDQERAIVALADRVVDLLELELRTRELGATVSQLERARAELQRSNEQLAAFAGQVSHDLLNPLTAVTMSLRLVGEQLEEPTSLDPSQLGWLVTRAVSGAHRMESLIEDLLSFARLGGRLVRAEVDLGAVLAEVSEDLAVALTDASLTAGALPVVSGDPVQLRAVVQNLIANAAKFVQPGVAPKIEVSAAPVAGGWRIEVADHGIGISPEHRERVFEPLARIDQSIAGCGIGLATVRRVIDSHGGRIGLAETPGGGTTAWFELPG
jgi:signal transduction histidine kinase